MIQELLTHVSVDRLREHIRSLEGVRHPAAAPEALERAADYIHTTLQSLNYAVGPHLFQVWDRDFRNVIATRPGVRHPEERVLILAHYDTVKDCPGADDNASSVAVLLEAARVLEPVAFDRTVQFVAVNLEEGQWAGPAGAGLFGSRALAIDAQQQGWNIAGVIALDTIAYAGEQIVQKTPEGLPISWPASGDFIVVGGNEISKDLVELFVQAVRRYRIPLPVVPVVVPGNGEAVRNGKWSDQDPFWDRGFKAVVLTDTADLRNPNYHRPTDTLETLNLPFLAQVCRAVVGMVADMAGSG